MQKFQCLVICIEAIKYLLLHNLHDCTFKVYENDQCKTELLEKYHIILFPI